MVFDEVHSDLESAGYEVQAVVIPAAAVNAPHGRDRVWFVAVNSKSSRSTEVGGICEGSDNESIGICAKNGITSNTQFKSEGSDGGTNDETQRNIRRGNEGDVFGTLRSDGDASNSDSTSTQCGNCQTTERRKDQGGRIEPLGFNMEWEKFPTQSPICGGDDGLPTELDGITFSKWRNESIKAYGNAIVPQVAYEIFKAIEATIQGVD